MESSPSDANPQKTDDDIPACDAPPQSDLTLAPSDSKSLWSRAKETLGGVSAHASKVTKLGSAGVAKTAAIGKQTLEVAGDVTRGAVEASKAAYSGSVLESAVNYVDGELDQRGAKTAFKETSDALVGKLDQVTGKRLVELLEAKLRAQDEYNDILATRLAEALDRITKLEARFNED